MTDIIKQAISEIQEEIQELNHQIKLIQSVDWSKPVNEKTWHALCDTNLRDSDQLNILVKNIFPDAENIRRGANYVFFNLYGFSCALPTSRTKGVFIDAKWYASDNGMPKPNYKEHRMYKYFQAKDNRENWEVLLDFKAPECKRFAKVIKFFLWFFVYKWKKEHRKAWEKDFERDKVFYEKRVKEYKQKRIEVREKVENMYYNLLPELSKFSKKFERLDNDMMIQKTSIRDMLKEYGFSK